MAKPAFATAPPPGTRDATAMTLIRRAALRLPVATYAPAEIAAAAAPMGPG